MGTPKNVFVFRHAEREDNINPGWAEHSSRPHDPPLSRSGRKQGRELAKYLQQLLTKMGVNEVVVYSSPLVRCVQTAGAVLEGLSDIDEGVVVPKLKIEYLFSERGRNIKRRMLGNHHTQTHLTRSNTRTVCHPILLEKGDLLGYYPDIDMSYRPSYKVEYSKDGDEMASGHPTTLDERINCNIRHFLHRPENHNKTVIIVSHGGVTRRVVEHLTSSHLPYRPGYTHLHVLERGVDEVGYKLSTSWHPHGVAPRKLKTNNDER